MKNFKKKNSLISLIIFITLVVFNISGCSSVSSPNSTQNSTQDKKQNNKILSENISSNKSTQSDSASYYTGILDKNELQVTRSNNKITAIYFPSYNLNMSVIENNNEIDSILFKELNKNIILQDKPESIENIGLSSDKKLLTIMFHYPYGTKLLVVNLKNGENFIFNNIIEKITGKFIEMLWSYSWEPKGERMAFAYGDTSTCKLAIYNFETKTLTPIQTNSNFIGTQKILWNKEGNQFDFISEYPADNFFLYRYSLINNKVIKIKKIISNEISTKFPEANINLFLPPKLNP